MQIICEQIIKYHFPQLIFSPFQCLKNNIVFRSYEFTLSYQFSDQYFYPLVYSETKTQYNFYPSFNLLKSLKSPQLFFDGNYVSETVNLTLSTSEEFYNQAEKQPSDNTLGHLDTLLKVKNAANYNLKETRSLTIFLSPQPSIEYIDIIFPLSAIRSRKNLSAILGVNDSEQLEIIFLYRNLLLKATLNTFQLHH